MPDNFTEILEELASKMSTAELLAIPGIYEILAEELNNEILEHPDFRSITLR